MRLDLLSCLISELCLRSRNSHYVWITRVNKKGFRNNTGFILVKRNEVRSQDIFCTQSEPNILVTCGKIRTRFLGLCLGLFRCQDYPVMLHKPIRYKVKHFIRKLNVFFFTHGHRLFQVRGLSTVYINQRDICFLFMWFYHFCIKIIIFICL